MLKALKTLVAATSLFLLVILLQVPCAAQEHPHAMTYGPAMAGTWQALWPRDNFAADAPNTAGWRSLARAATSPANAGAREDERVDDEDEDERYCHIPARSLFPIATGRQGGAR